MQENNKMKMNQRAGKNVLLFVVGLLFSCFCFAQVPFVVPKNMPPFNMSLSNGSGQFNRNNLQKGRPVIIIYFDPGCDHCKKYVQTLLQHIQPFKKTQIVMISGVGELAPVQKFVQEFGLDKYPFIKVGTEGLYRPTLYFYRVEITPFTALYDAHANLIAYYRNVPTVNELVKQLHL